MKIARKIVVIGATSGIAEHCCRLWAVEQPVGFVLVARDKAKLDKIAADLKVRSPDSTITTVLGDFLDYNDFLGDADRLLEARKLDGVIQIASFHPGYQFAGTAPDAVENYTNRSPYPMLHLLREASVTAVADDVEALRAIPRRNIATMRGLGLADVLRRLERLNDRDTE